MKFNYVFGDFVEKGRHTFWDLTDCACACVIFSGLYIV